MSALKPLLSGELLRMKKYNILAASFLVALIWIAVLHFSGIDAGGMLVLLVFLDVTAMGSLLIGVGMFFEKQENTIKTMLVAPISKEEYIWSKILANMITAFITMTFLVVYARYVKGTVVRIPILVLGLILGIIVYSMIGFVLTYRARDFTGMLMGLLSFNMLLTIPVILDYSGLINNEIFSKLMYALPTKAILTLMMAATSQPAAWEIYLSIGYILVFSFLLYRFIVNRFDEFSAKESGV
jgi:fluoroquinolone transport system permease protein